MHITDVARKVRNLRSHIGVSQQILSNASGVSRRTIQRVEKMDNLHSTYVPRLDTVSNLADSFGMGLSAFLSTSTSKLPSLVV